MKYRERYVEVEAVQWFKDGDHPKVEAMDVPEGCTQQECRHCAKVAHVHGWIDKTDDARDGIAVCPGDWVIEHDVLGIYTLKPDVFPMIFEPVGGEKRREDSAGQAPKEPEPDQVYREYPETAEPAGLGEIAIICPICQKINAPAQLLTVGPLEDGTLLLCTGCQRQVEVSLDEAEEEATEDTEEDEE